ncbi:MAG TPA: hypothetical protein VFI95_05050 [Terriglobales bacterium]|nr:hypothetical protein [Terriglobales bacterium]
MRSFVALLFVAFLAPVTARANSITIGQLQYLGTNAQGMSAFKVTLNTTGVTAAPLVLANVFLMEKGITQQTGLLTTPVAILFAGGPGLGLPGCPCPSISLQLQLSANGNFVTFRLANGELFTTRSDATFVLRPLGGHKHLEPGQSVPLVLVAVPELQSSILFLSGLAAVFACCYRRLIT